MFNLIPAAELALVATRNAAKPFVATLVQDKLVLLKALQTDLGMRAQVELNALKGLLDVKEYIASHNLSSNLGDFGSLVYNAMPDRTTTINYTERVCDTYIDECGSGHRMCHDEPRSRIEPDRAFHSARDSHVAVIEIKRKEISDQIDQITQLSGIIVRLENYRIAVLSVASEDTNVTLFHSMELPPGAGIIPTISGKQKAIFHEYFDDLDKVPPAAFAASGAKGTQYFEVITRHCPPT